MNIEAIRAERQAALNAKVDAIRVQASAKMAAFEQIDGTINRDPAFNTQPVPSNSRAASFVSARRRERAKFDKAMGLYQEAKELTAKADHMERSGVRVAGDAERERQAVIASSDFSVGDMVTTLYGVRKIIKVNAKTIKIESSSGGLIVPKNLAKLVAGAA